MNSDWRFFEQSYLRDKKNEHQIAIPMPIARVKLINSLIRGGLGGGGEGADAFFHQGFDPLPTQRVPPLYYFDISIFGLLTLKFF